MSIFSKKFAQIVSLIIVSIITVLILSGCGKEEISNDDPKPQPEKEVYETFSLFREEGDEGIITYKKPEDEDFLELTENQIELPNDTTIKTEDGYAHVIYPDNSMMSIDKDTEVTIHFDEKNITIQQIIGNTWHRLQKLAEGQSYDVTTSNALATVRGTKWGVYAQDGLSQFLVTENQIDLQELDEKGNPKGDKKGVDEGKEGKVGDNGPEVGEQDEELKKKGWYRRNEYLDRHYNDFLKNIGPNFERFFREFEGNPDLKEFSKDITPTPTPKIKKYYPRATETPEPEPPVSGPVN